MRCHDGIETKSKWCCAMMCRNQIDITSYCAVPKQNRNDAVSIISVLSQYRHLMARLVLGLRPANQRRRYEVTPSLIGLAQNLESAPWWHVYREFGVMRFAIHTVGNPRDENANPIYFDSAPGSLPAAQMHHVYITIINTNNRNQMQKQSWYKTIQYSSRYSTFAFDFLPWCERVRLSDLNKHVCHGDCKTHSF